VDDCILITGADPFLVREALEEVLAKHPEEEVSRVRLEAKVLAEETSQRAALFDDLKTPSLFGGRRCVIVEHAAGLMSGSAGESLVAYAERPSPGTRLILLAPSADRRYKAVKALLKTCRSIECKPPDPKTIPAWIARRAQEHYGLELTGAAVRELLSRLGRDLGPLDAALGRLQELIAPETRVEAQDVAHSTADHRSEIYFEPANALEAGDLPRTLAAIETAFTEGLKMRQGVVVDAGALGVILLDNLHKAYLKMLRIGMLLREGASEREAVLGAGASPKAAWILAKQARKHGVERLVARHGFFREADRALKTGGGGGRPRRVLEALVMRLLEP